MVNKSTTEAVNLIAQDLEKLTRRSMKIQVTEYIKERCNEDEAFAKQVLNPKKSLSKCFNYINSKAMEWIKKDAEAMGEEIKGSIGGDVPDDIVFDWAIEYYQNEETEEELKLKTKEAKSEPKKKVETKDKLNKKPIAEQISLTI